MKIGIHADLHLRGSDLEERLELHKRMLDHMESQGVGLVLNAGDTFDSGNVGDSKESWETIWNGYVRNVKESGIEHVIVEGNHDYWNPKGVSGVECMHNIEGIHVISRKPSGYYHRGTDTLVLGMPWMDPLRSSILDEEKERDLILQWFDSLSAQNVSKKILLGHLEINGSVGDNGLKLYSTGINSWSIQQLIALGCDYVFLGHYHKAQAFDGNIFYPGSLCQKNFGEAGNCTGYLILREDGSIARHELQGTSYYKHVYDRPVDTLLRGPFINAKAEVIDDEHYCSSRDESKMHVRVYEADTPSKVKEVEKLFKGKCKTLKFIERTAQVSDRDQNVEIEKEMPFQDKLEAWVKDSGLQLDVEEVKDCIDAFDDITIDNDQVGFLEKFHSAKLQNIYKVHVDRSLIFEPGSSCIVGPNGSGKTLILESLFAGLYGKWVSANRSFSDTGTKAKLEVEFTSRGEHYKVTRDKVVTVYRKVGEAFEEVAGGPSKTAQANEFLKALVGSEDMVKRCCYIDNSGNDFIESTPAVRMQWIRDWLGFKVYEEYNKYCVDQYKLYKGAGERRKQILDFIEISKGEVSYDTAQKLHYSAILKEQQDIKKDLEQQLSDIEDELGVIRKAVDYRKNKAIVENALKESLEKLDKYKSNQTILLESVQDIDKRLEDLGPGRDAYKAMSLKIESLKSISKEIEKAGCASKPIPCFFISRGLQALEEVKNLEKELAKCKWSFSLEEEYTNLQTKKQDHILRLTALKNSISSTLQIIELQKKQIDSYAEDLSHVDISSYESLVLRKEKLNQELIIVNSQVVDLSAKVKIHDYNINKANNHLIELENKLENANKEWAREKSLEVLVKASSREGLVQSLIYNELPKIQKYINSLLSSIDADFSITLATQREKKSGDLKEVFDILFSRRGTTYDIRSGSSGERALVKVIIRLAILLTRSDSRYKVLFLDEPTAASDVTYRDTTLKLLSLCKKSFSQIIMVTHDSVVSTFATNIIKLGGDDA